MQEYLENSALLGWLFDLENLRLYLYEQDHPVRRRQSFAGRLSAEPHLPASSSTWTN